MLLGCSQNEEPIIDITGKWTALSVPNTVRYTMTNCTINIRQTTYEMEYTTYTGQHENQGAYRINENIITIWNSFHYDMDNPVKNEGSIYYLEIFENLMIWTDTTNNNLIFVWNQ